MQPARVTGVVVLCLGLALLLACSRQSPVPIAASASAQAVQEGRLPFDREAQTEGISPTSSVIPPGAQVPAGTPVNIRLLTKLSSAHAHSEDTFKAVLDGPMIVNDEVLAERGTEVVGRVVSAGSTLQQHAAGYLRLTLSSIRIVGNSTPIRTSSVFLKGAGPGRRNPAIAIGGESAVLGAVASTKGALLDSAMVADSAPMPAPVNRPREAMVGPDRRLTFRLIDPLPLHP